MKTTEENLIERIRRRIPSAEGGALRLGIGDDAAVLRPPAGADWVVTCDPFLEDVHFLAEAHARPKWSATRPWLAPPATSRRWARGRKFSSSA